MWLEAASKRAAVIVSPPDEHGFRGFGDGVVGLIGRGVINNEKKTLPPGKVIVGFVLGTRWLYDFIDNNPIFEFHPSE